MAEEEDLVNKLISKFTFLQGRIKLQRKRRIFAETDYQNFRALFDYAVKELAFSFLCTITGLDEGENLALIYHLSRQDGTILNVKTSFPKNNPIISTITNVFPSADIYEREVMDLLGVKVLGLPEGKRYPLPDDWPEGEYPLRKDWKKESQSKEADKNA
jgi:membrane-bound hydrogenase subunit beta